MSSGTTRKPAPPRILSTLAGLVFGALGCIEVVFSGMTPNVYAYLAIMTLGLLKMFGATGSTRLGYWVHRYLEWAMVLFVGLPVAGLVLPRVNDLPIFAHVEVEARALGNSSTVSSSFASPGHRFVVVEASVKPMMLADLGYLYYGDFLLQAGGSNMETADPSLDVPGACRDLQFGRFATVQCNLVFEVPDGVRKGRLIYDDYNQHASSEEFAFPAVPAPVPHVLIEVLGVQRVSRIARPFAEHAEEGKEFLYVDLRLESVREPRPYELDHFILVHDGQELLDESPYEGVSDPCSGIVLEGHTTCTALFEIPTDVTEVRIYTRRYDFEDDYGVEIAGMVDIALDE